MSDRKRVGPAIVELLRADPGRVHTAATVTEALGGDVTYKLVQDMLCHLVAHGQVVRVGRDRYAAGRAVVDPVAVERLCSATWPSPSLATDAEREQAVRRMLGWGLSDGQIADRLGGITASGVQAFRARLGIAVSAA